MLKGLLIAPFAALLVAGTAQAASLQTLTLNHDQNDRGLHAAVVEVQTHRNTFSIIAQDALYGGIAGLAIGAGVALLQNDGNWVRDLTIARGRRSHRRRHLRRRRRRHQCGPRVSGRRAPRPRPRFQPRGRRRQEVLARRQKLTRRDPSCRAVSFPHRGQIATCASFTPREQTSE
jgi:hypothetical protein